ncbi:Protein-lysine N-methyltransferase efm5 [Polyrhizophydium stewartii]|uniref:Protein-lysine N-methyltransferase EFM5 n=1 Tax=Polyrhizophydium stewartii TaxID=2732419 RepID=A0ABR4NFM7_9FUNG|nr:EEF1A lysine methyltransferase 1 [Polyrhizophydium stewartii]
MADPDDDDLQLSASTLAALQEFIKEKTDAEAKFQALKEAAHREADAAAELARKVDMVDFKEDWQLSQFWYSDSTRDKLAAEALRHTPPGGRVGCVSSPSAYVTLKRTSPASLLEGRELFVFEFDRRFDVYGNEFVFYDYSSPTDLDEQEGRRPLRATFDFLIIDPPFLSDECWTKTAQTARWLGKPDCKFLVCTGQVMGPKVCAELGCVQTTFLPEHQNGLKNEFRSYINYESEALRRVK